MLRQPARAATFGLPLIKLPQLTNLSLAQLLHHAHSVSLDLVFDDDPKDPVGVLFSVVLGRGQRNAWAVLEQLLVQRADLGLAVEVPVDLLELGEAECGLWVGREKKSRVSPWPLGSRASLTTT